MRHGPSLAGLAGATALAAAATARAQEPSAFDWWPSQTEFGTVAFEDLWPAKGDADYNDLGVRVHVARSALVNGETTALEYSFQIWTLGASDCGGFALVGRHAGCGFSGPGTGGDTKKLYMDADYSAHVASLHSGGGFCGWDNRARYAAATADQGVVTDVPGFPGLALDLGALWAEVDGLPPGV